MRKPENNNTKTTAQDEAKARDNDISDEIFIADGKLDLTRTLLSLLINMVEDGGEVKTSDEAFLFAMQKNTLSDLLHVTLDEMTVAQESLSKAQNILSGRCAA